MNFLYWFGFYIEYRLRCLLRGLAGFSRWLGRALGALLAALLRPVVLACIRLRQASPKALLGLLVPALGALAFAWLVQTTLAQPFALRVEVNGTVVGYVANEQDFDTARTDVQARVNTARALLEAAGAAMPDWDLDPAFTLAVSSNVMTPREIANAILQASGSEITEGTAVYMDGTLRFVTTEGDHLRTLLAAVRRPYLNPADADSRVVFAHDLQLVDGIYLTGSVSPYREIVKTLQADDGELLRVQIRRRERYEQELTYDTQTVEDDTLDFGKSETVQTGVPGRETVTYEVVYENGVEVDSRVLDVSRTAEPVPEVIRRGTRLQSGMIGKLGTGSFIWPVPAYRHISRWADLRPGSNYHRAVDIAAPYGTEIYAADAGTVVECTRHWSWGNYVKIDHGNGYQTLYAHMSAQAVHVGDTVTQGQVIGYVGNTGNSYGNHCHFEMYYNNRLFSAREVFPDMPEWNQ